MNDLVAYFFPDISQVTDEILDAILGGNVESARARVRYCGCGAELPKGRHLCAACRAQKTQRTCHKCGKCPALYHKRVCANCMPAARTCHKCGIELHEKSRRYCGQCRATPKQARIRMCHNCGASPVLRYQRYCDACKVIVNRAKWLKYAKTYRAKYPEAYRERRRRYYRRNAERIKAYANKYRRLHRSASHE